MVSATADRLCSVVQGLQQIVLFCGDGINDLSALSAADVGYAVGATEASVAAAVSTTHGSVSGAVCSFLGTLNDY